MLPRRPPVRRWDAVRTGHPLRDPDARSVRGILLAGAVLVTLWLGATSAGAAGTQARQAGVTPLAPTATTVVGRRSSTIPRGTVETTTPASGRRGTETTDVPTTEASTTEVPSTATPSTATPTTVAQPGTTAPALEQRATESDQATTRLNRVVIGLLVLAVVIAGATVYFWIRTRPDRHVASSAPLTPDPVRSDGPRPGPAPADPQPVGSELADPPDVGADPGPDEVWQVAPAPVLPGEVAAAGTAPVVDASTDEVSGEDASREDASRDEASRDEASWWASQSSSSSADDADDGR